MPLRKLNWSDGKFQSLDINLSVKTGENQILQLSREIKQNYNMSFGTSKVYQCMAKYE